MNPLDGHTRRVAEAIGGDAVSLTLLLAEHHDHLRATLERRIPPDLRGRLAAEDVLQEAYVQVFRHVAQFQPRDADSFEHWLRTIAGNQLRNSIKAQRAARRGGAGAVNRIPVALEQSFLSLLDMAAGAGRTPSRSVARGEAAAAIRAALSDLPEQYHQALWLVYVEGCTAASAGRQMGRSERAIHGLCRRGLALLRDRLGGPERLLSFKG